MRKLLITSILGLAILAVLWLAAPAYKRWREQRSLQQALECFARADYRTASVGARSALRLNPANVEASRIMAQIAELAGSPQAIAWRLRVAELEPQILKNHLDVVRAALSQRDLARAQRALEGVNPAGTQTPEFHQVAALVAAARGESVLAMQHFAEAARIEPQNPLHRLNLAVLQLESPERTVADAAAKDLESLLGDSKVRSAACRLLAAHFFRSSDARTALVYTTLLQAAADAGFGDRLMHLTALDRSEQTSTNQTGTPSPDPKPGETAAYLARLEKLAQNRAEDVYSLAAWMLEGGRTNRVLQWLSGLPADLKQQPPVSMALADSLTAVQDWEGLQTLLATEEWPGFEFLRLAMLAHASLKQGQAIAAKTRWRGAVNEARESPRSLTLLHAMAKAWGWDKEAEDLLWSIAERFPWERRILNELEARCLARGDTRGLLRVYSTLGLADPKNLEVKNNLATVCLLLRTQLDQAHELAREVHALRPESAPFLATYAYSLHLQGRTREGVAALGRLSAEQLAPPTMAAYYGVLLAAAGDTNAAREYLAKARTARLLPEERELVTGALPVP